LTFSLGLPFAPHDWSGLSLTVWVAVAESLHAEVGLKWPNDLWVADRKLGGILIETASFGAAEPRYAVIGVGPNIQQPQATDPAGPPAWVTQLLPDLAAGDVLSRVSPALVFAVQAFESGGFATFQTRFEARDVLRGREVALSDGTRGRASGTNASGGLLVHT